jgi:hypothetical protein
MGLRLCLCGTGWDKIVSPNPTTVIMGNVHYNEQFNLYRQSKALINLDPNWTHGMHDRVFNALSCGCLVITGANNYGRFLNNSQNSLIFFNKISEIPQKIAIAMDRPVSEGEFDLSQNTWIDRAINFTEQILQR